MLRADHPFRGKKLSIKQFQSVEHIVVDAIGRNLTVDRILVQNKINRKVALIVSGYASLAPIISSSNLIVTLPRALGMRMAAATPGLKVMEPPVRIPPVIVAQYWHRKLQNEARNQWLRNTLKGIISQQHEAPERLK
jgi:DNA-binding transcriptional LysR family regulator